MSYIHFWELNNIESLNKLPPLPLFLNWKTHLVLKKISKMVSFIFQHWKCYQNIFQYLWSVYLLALEKMCTCVQKRMPNFEIIFLMVHFIWSVSTCIDHTTCSNIVFCHIKHIPWWHSILTSIYMTISKQYIVWNDKIKTHSNFTPIRENNVVLQNIGEGCCTYIDQIHWKHIKYIDFWWFIINAVQKDDLIFKKNLDILYNEWYKCSFKCSFFAWLLFIFVQQYKSIPLPWVVS